MDYALRQACQNDVVDYQELLTCLTRYKAPHRKITQLLRDKTLIRVKKGLYVFTEEIRQQPLELSYLANLIYGPSYVSLDYALSYYGMIPERVYTVTSMTTKKHKFFATPISDFSYTYLSPTRFTVGVDWQSFNQNRHFLIASPEKALADSLANTKHIETADEMYQHLTENLRIDNHTLMTLNELRLRKIAKAYRKASIFLLCSTLQRLR